MSEEMQIDGKSYISSKRASQLSGYAQDYIGQLARKSLIDARRIGGLWYVSMESLEEYKKKADEYKPEPPTARSEVAEPGTLVFFDGKEYLSAARAAEITGYTQDYVGQLGRSGKILSQQVGNRWYVEKDSITGHKAEKDRLLAAVQRESVGLQIPQTATKNTPKYLANTGYSGAGPILNYYHEENDLMALTEKAVSDADLPTPVKGTEDALQELKINTHVYSIPIKRRYKDHSGAIAGRVGSERMLPMPRKSLLPMIIGAAATIVIVLSVGYASIFKQNSAYALGIRHLSDISTLPASVGAAVGRIGDILEPLLTRELIYTRSDSQ